MVAQKSANVHAPQSPVIGGHCASVVQPTQVSSAASQTVPARQGETPSCTLHVPPPQVSPPLQSTPSSQLPEFGVCMQPESVQRSSVQALPSSQPVAVQLPPPS